MSRTFFAAGALFAACGLAAADGRAANLLDNGRFTDGSAGRPTGWSSEAWTKDASAFGWNADDQGNGQISITSPVPNDARWCQSVTVAPGATYRVSARVKTRDVGAETAGALIAIEPRIADSRDVRGTQDWQTLEVTAQAGVETTWDVCLRLGSYANLNTGTVWFTDVDLVQVRSAATRREPRRSLTLPALGLLPSTSWHEVASPLAGGLLLAFGLGLLGGRRTPP